MENLLQHKQTNPIGKNTEIKFIIQPIFKQKFSLLEVIDKKKRL